MNPTQSIITRIEASFARETLKEQLATLPEANVTIFKCMYSPGDLDKDINAVVDDMPDRNLDWAMQQVQRTIDIRNNK